MKDNDWWLVILMVATCAFSVTCAFNLPDNNSVKLKKMAEDISYIRGVAADINKDMGKN